MSEEKNLSSTHKTLPPSSELRKKVTRLSRVRWMIVAPVLCAAFALSCLALTAPKTEPTPLTQDDKNTFTQLAPEGMLTPESVSIRGEGQSYTLRSGEGGYTLNGADAELNEQAARNLLSCGTSILARSRIEEGNRSEFGLGEDAFLAVFTYANAQTLTLRLGDAPATGEGRYAAVDGDEHIYVINTSLYHTLSAGENALYALPDFSDIFTAYTLMEVTLAQPQRETITIKRVLEQNPFNTVAQFTAPLIYPANSERTADLFLALEQIKPVSLLDKDGVDATYGLDAPLADITLTGEQGQTLRLRLGRMDDRLTLRVDEQNAVYALAPDAADFLQTVSVAYLAEQLPGLVALTQVKDLTLTQGDESHTLHVDRFGEQERFYMNGYEAGFDDFRLVYQKAIGLLIDRRLKESVLLQPDAIRASFTYMLTNGEEWTLSFMAYDDQYDAVVRDGTANFLIARTKVDAVFESIKQWMEDNGHE